MREINLAEKTAVSGAGVTNLMAFVHLTKEQLTELRKWALPFQPEHIDPNLPALRPPVGYLPHGIVAYRSK